MASVEMIEVDHRHPRAHGGKDEMSNLQLAHSDCNRAKSDTLAVRAAESSRATAETTRTS